MTKSPGFTLIELLITLALMSVIVAMAVPSFRGTIQASSLKTTARDFIGALNLARTEAIRRSRPVQLCKSSTGTTCAVAGNWEQGWLAYVDNDNANTLNAGDTILRVWPGLPDRYSLRGEPQFDGGIRYNAQGVLSSQAGAFVLCIDNDLQGAKAIALTRLRPRLGVDTNNDGIPEKDDGVNSINVTSCETP